MQRRLAKEAGEAHGVATAAAIWTTGGIGASVAYGYYAIAATLCVLSLFILGVMPRLGQLRSKAKVDRT